MEIVTTYILEGVFLVVFGIVLFRYLRRPTALDRDVLAVFAAVTALFVLGYVGDFVPGHAWIGTLGTILLLAQPYLTVRLVRHFEPLPAIVELAALAAFAAAAALIVIGISGNRLGLIYVVSYFVVVETLGAVQLFRAARRRVGTARTRLTVAGLATLLFGLAILIIGAAAASGSGSESASASVIAVARFVALAAGIGYLIAFAPPRFLRRIGHQAIAFRLNQDLLAHPLGTPPARIWANLASAARQVTGARAAVVIGPGPDGTLLAQDGEWRDVPVIGASYGRPRGARAARGRLDRRGRLYRRGRLERRRIRDQGGTTSVVHRAETGPYAELARSADAATTIVVPLEGASGDRGHLVMFVAGTPLFVDDDVAVLSTLAASTVGAVEREEALDERSSLVRMLRETNQELARASAAKSDFLAAMSHELRTPLNSIIGFSELLMAPMGPGQGRRGLDVVDQAAHIHGAGVELLDLINEVLDLARVEAGRLELRYDRFDLALLADRTVAAMSPLAERRAIDLRLAAEETVVEGDPARIRQILYNLLANAIKFSPDEGIVELSVTSANGQAVVSVTDEGPGIPAAEQALVFEAFGQGQAGRRDGQGSGLGLALARQLAEAHGGGIELDSRPPGGSTFTLRLPLRRPDAVGEGSRDALPGSLVLVIEDDLSSVALIRSWLEPEGYVVRSAADGAHGLRLAESLLPDAILLDILLPDLDGWEVLQRLRHRAGTRAIPILVISVVDEQQLGLALGAADYFVKPVDRGLLLDRLRQVTRPSRPDDSLVVLAVDPEASALDAYRTALDGSARVIVAASGTEGREIAFSSRPDAVLLDLGIEDMSPFALLAELREHPATRAAALFAVTSQGLSEDARRRLTGQVAAILEKEGVAEGLASWLASVSQRPGAIEPDAVEPVTV